VREWLRLRGLSAGHVVDLDLARALPDEADAVSWAEGWRAGYRLILPVYGPSGDIESVRARWVDTPRTVKVMAPKGWGSGAMTGCVLANPVAVELLGGERTVPTTVVVVEGEPDFLTWAIRRPDLAVFGVWQGAWSADLSAKVPAGSTVVIRTDHDRPGESYATAIAATLSHVTVLRAKPDPADETRDENDRLRAGTLPSDPTDDAEPFEGPAAASVSGLPLVRRKGVVIADRTNAILLLERHPIFRGEVWFNDFDGSAYVGRQRFDDALLIDLAVDLSRETGTTFQLPAVYQALVHVARRDRRHPVADRLRSFLWDGVKRLHRLLPDYFGTPDDALHQQLGVVWATGAVSRPLAPGNKLDNTLIWVGPQGSGKSTAAQVLAIEPEWFNDTPVDLRSKDARQALDGTFILEWAEMDSLKRSDLSAMKAFLTDTVDRYRRPYDKVDVFRPRSTVFIGTSNEFELLRDPTGDRRFWPVETTDIDLDALRRDRDQLWAEAVARFDTGASWWPDPALEARLQEHRAAFEATDAWMERISTWLDDEQPETFTINDVLERALDLSARDTTKRGAEMRVSALLRRLGYRPGTRPRKGRSASGPGRRPRRDDERDRPRIRPR
jgi:predicted P-loop ATPase